MIVALLVGLCLGFLVNFTAGKYSAQKPYSPALTMVLFALGAYTMDGGLAGWLGGLMACVLLALALIDLQTMIIPDGFHIVILALGVMALFTDNSVGLVERLIGFFVLSLPMYAMICFIGECFGGGDIKLIAVSGFFLGWQNTLLAGFISIVLGGAVGSYLLMRKKVKKDTQIPFGPYLCMGIYSAMLWGDSIIGWYLSLLGF